MGPYMHIALDLYYYFQVVFENKSKLTILWMALGSNSKASCVLLKYLESLHATYDQNLNFILFIWHNEGLNQD